MQLLTCWVGPISAPNPALVLAATTPLTPNAFLVTTPVDLGGYRRIYVTFTGGEPTTSYVLISGKGWGNASITEAIFAPAVGTVSISTFDYYQVDSVRTGNVAFAGAVTIGTGVLASSRWLRFDDYMAIFYQGQVNAFGTVNYTVETTMDDPTQDPPPGLPAIHPPIWFPSSDPALVGASTSRQTLLSSAYSFVRVTLNSSGNGSGDYVEGKFTQHSSVPSILQ